MGTASRGALIASALLALAACGRSGLDAISPGGFVVPLPQGDIPSLTLDAGDGHDGPLDVTAASLPINSCRVIGSSGAQSAALGSTTGIVPGTRLLLWQVQAPLGLAVGNTSAILALGTAGRFEIAQVVAVQPSVSVVQLESPLDAAYRSGGGFRAQACIVPQYTTVTIAAGAHIAADPWNGSTGGVVAFFASGAVSIGASGGVTATGDGFRGGKVVVNGGGNGDKTAETTNNQDGGEKGEGLDPASVGLYGKGNLANGAGGGNAENAGGGGGGGGGIGGCGGREFQSFNNNPLLTRGRPGAPVSVPVASRLVPGGGGGAGQQNQNGATPGGDGGGVIWISAVSIGGAGRIESDGTTPTQATQDGGSGGGGGGTIVVRAGGGSFSGTISASGGGGGDADDSNGDTGPGGGGGGGRVLVQGLPSAVIAVTGGAHGMSLNTNVAFFSDDGQPGVVEIP